MRTASGPLVIIAAVILLAAIFDMLASAAEAQPARTRCGERAAIVAKLSEGYGERQRESRVNDKGTIVYEFWASRRGSWTLLMTTTRGVSWLVATGGGWKPEDDA